MGGGIIKTAAKAASFGAYRSPLIDETARRASRHQVAALSSASPALESGLTVPLLSSDKEQAETSAVTHWPAWELDDWKHVGGRVEEKFGSANPSHRQIFGPAPSLEEAKEATADLKDALEKIYYQPNPTLNSHEGCQMSVSCESNTVSTVPKHVAQMFSLLQRSTEAQSVVASLASDKSVWDAVMKNEKVIEFCKNPLPASESVYAAESVAANESVGESSPSLESKETSEGSMIADIVKNFKVKVLEVVNNISDFLQDILEILPGNSNSGNTTASTDKAYNDATLGASFVALAVATVMVILLKRG
ncbi:hypothetical protein KSP39_PZI016906 [Platanthera zijinensis]|uniref:Uncharacterized protein n=1 Tax=Platanthera zijinensis TaxID=2320716 RepID=A0AAP0B644_9ASPA